MNLKKLAILSDCIHMVDANGKVLTENHIYRKQIEMLASHFSQTIIFCPFTEYSQDKVGSFYKAENIQFYPLKNVGGNNLKAKFDLIKTIPSWLTAFRKANNFADIVYQRFPNNLNVPGFFYFYFKKAKTFATYTGNWKDYKHEPLSYRLQKWLLKKYFRGFVGIYIDQQPKDLHLLKTFSPSYTLKDWTDETKNIDKKIEVFRNEHITLPIFLTVGSLVPHKNQQYTLDTFKILAQQNFDFRLYIVGDGVLNQAYAKFIIDNKLEDKIVLTGKMTDLDLRKLYRKAHFLIQSPLSEGFGKVPIEGFFHGVIPFLNNTAMAAEMVGLNNERGFIFTINEPAIFAQFVSEAINQKELFPLMIKSARQYARLQTLENWTNIYIKQINKYFEKN